MKNQTITRSEIRAIVEAECKNVLNFLNVTKNNLENEPEKEAITNDEDKKKSMDEFDEMEHTPQGAVPDDGYEKWFDDMNKLNESSKALILKAFYDTL